MSSTYEVFLSFRGEDTRYNFTSHLYGQLTGNGIHTFRDDEELEIGGAIASQLSRAMEESKCFVVIFSENYARSRWCLNELLKIIECMNTDGRMVLSVFYRVDPSDVRKQRGSYGEAFSAHEIDADDEKKEKIQKWRTALTEAANLSGYHLQEHEYESKLVEQIVDNIRRRLNSQLLHIDKNIVGKDFCLKELKQLLNLHSNDVCMVGIYGIGGIGKTTTAKMVYNDILFEFEGSCFLENVRERFKGYSGKLEMLEELLHGIFMGKYMKLFNINDGVNAIKDRLRLKKVLIVLDDIDHLDQLKLLVESHEWFGPGSRILITTRDKHLLHVHGVDRLYEVKELPWEEATLLFSRHAFKLTVPTKDYADLSMRVVQYAKGLPLALKVLGSFLYGRLIDEWHGVLDQLKRKSNVEIHNVLRISFDGLDDTNKEIFLDIACFLKGEDKDVVLRILEGCNFYPKVGIKVLCDRCLIKISNNEIDMHDLIQQMGWDIVRENFPKEPSKWSRLWDPDDITKVFSRKEGMKKIEVLSMDLSCIQGIQFNTKFFSKMKRLRLLKVHWRYHINCMENEYKLLLPKDFEFPSYELRYLHWDGYSLKSLPSTFDGENIVELHLRKSSLKRLWKGYKFLDKLMVIDLSYSEKLIKLPKFSNMPNLKTLDLEGCINLKKFHPSMGDLKKLAFLNLGGCKSLRRLPSSIELESLEILDLSNCSSVEKFPEVQGNAGHLRTVLLYGTSITELPTSIGYLESLRFLNLSDCAYFEKFLDIIEGNLRHLGELNLEGTAITGLPSSIGYLESLEILVLSNCSSFEKFPDIIEGNLRHLRKLDLGGTAITGLPSSIGYLESLEILDLSNCSSFEKFPDIIEGNMRHLRKLHLGGSAIRELPRSIGYLESLKVLSLSNCAYFEKFPDIIEGNMRQLKELHLAGTAIGELPRSIGYFERLKIFDLYDYQKRHKFPEIDRNMEWMELELNNTAIVELPSSIYRLIELSHLYLTGCKNLRSIPNSIWRLKFLCILCLCDCSNLEAFPEVTQDMEVLEELHLGGTAIEKLPSSIQHLKRLKRLVLNGCENLASLAETTGNLRSIKQISLGNPFNVRKSPENLRGLQFMDGIDLPLASLTCLRCLKELDLNPCHLMDEKIPSSIWCLHLFKVLNLSENSIWRLPAGIVQLVMLIHLQLSPCMMLREISILPPNLQTVEVHDYPCLTVLWIPTSLFSYSLHDCFESIIQEYEDGNRYHRRPSYANAIAIIENAMISWGIGIRGWIGQQNTGNEVRIELPVNWYKDNNLLGFAFFFLFYPCCELLYKKPGLECHLTFLGEGSEFKDNLWFESWYSCDIISNGGGRGSLDPGLWLTYYPKGAITAGRNNINNHANGWTTLEALFDFTCNNCHGKDEPLAREGKCGILLVYELQALLGDSGDHKGSAEEVGGIYNYIKRSRT